MIWRDQHSTVPAPTKVGAYLGTSSFGHAFRFNPSSAEWSYNNTMYSQDTIGGRIVQILSVNIEALTIQGFAGSRNELQRMAINIREIMQYHIETLNPVDFKVPSRNWNFKVYVEAMPQIGWDFASTSYPYTLQLRILEDISGTKSAQIKNKALTALTQLNEGIGYIPGVHGGNAKHFVDITATLAENLVANGTINPSSSSQVPSSATGTGADALRTAITVEGKEYIFGAFNTPDDGAPGVAFDCSGLTRWAYESVGISIGGTANCQYLGAKAAGVFFSGINNLQPGDLMFWDFSGNGCADHVALFVSQARGMTIFHAVRKETPIGYDYGYSLDKYIGAARPVGNFPSVSNCICR